MRRNRPCPYRRADTPQRPTVDTWLRRHLCTRPSWCAEGKMLAIHASSPPTCPCAARSGYRISSCTDNSLVGHRPFVLGFLHPQAISGSKG